jgi:hypothetical protein
MCISPLLILSFSIFCKNSYSNTIAKINKLFVMILEILISTLASSLGEGFLIHPSDSVTTGGNINYKANFM